MSAGRQAGTHCQSTRKPSMPTSEPSPVRIWASMICESGHAAEVRVMVMTAVRSRISTARTNPRSTMFTPRSGSITSASASRTASTSSSAAVAAGSTDDIAGTGSDAESGSVGRAWGGGTRSAPLVACRPAGRRMIRTWQAGLWIQSAMPSLRRTRTMSSVACALPSATTSSAGSRPAASACTMARSSSRATGSQVRPGPKRSRALADTAGWPAMRRRAARASPSVTRSCGSSTCHCAAKVVPMRPPYER